MTEILNMLLTVLRFIAEKIMTIQIANISILGWIIAIIIITAVVTFAFKQSENVNFKTRSDIENNEIQIISNRKPEKMKIKVRETDGGQIIKRE